LAPLSPTTLCVKWVGWQKRMLPTEAKFSARFQLAKIFVHKVCETCGLEYHKTLQQNLEHCHDYQWMLSGLQQTICRSRAVFQYTVGISATWNFRYLIFVLLELMPFCKCDAELDVRYCQHFEKWHYQQSQLIPDRFYYWTLKERATLSLHAHCHKLYFPTPFNNSYSVWSRSLVSLYCGISKFLKALYVVKRKTDPLQILEGYFRRHCYVAVDK